MKNWYTEVVDNSYHHYVIPLIKLGDWNNWLNLDENEEEAWETPRYAERIDGGNLIFKDYKID